MSRHPRRSRAADRSTGPSISWWAASCFTLASGFSALVYQVLWLKELGLLLGNTAHASATGLAIFFAGLAVLVVNFIPDVGVALPEMRLMPRR